MKYFQIFESGHVRQHFWTGHHCQNGKNRNIECSTYIVKLGIEGFESGFEIVLKIRSCFVYDFRAKL